MAAKVRRELAQHGARSVAFAKAKPLQGSLQEGCLNAKRRWNPGTPSEAGEGNETASWQSKSQIQCPFHGA